MIIEAEKNNVGGYNVSSMSEGRSVEYHDARWALCWSTLRSLGAYCIPRRKDDREANYVETFAAHEPTSRSRACKVCAPLVPKDSKQKLKDAGLDSSREDKSTYSEPEPSEPIAGAVHEPHAKERAYAPTEEEDHEDEDGKSHGRFS